MVNAQLFDALPWQSAVLDQSGQIVAVNEAWRRFGEQNGLVMPDHAVGAGYLSVCDGARGRFSDEAQAAADGIRAVIAGHTPQFELDEYPCPSPTKERWFGLMVTPCPVEGGRGALVVHTDVTKRKQTERTLRDQDKLLASAQRMEAIGRLAGGIAHDFNNLLTVMLGCAELLRQGFHGDEKAEGYLDEIVRAAETAASLTKQLLAFSRRQVVRPERLEPGEVLDGMLPMLRRLLGEHVQLTTTTSPFLMPLRMDRGQLEQLIINLALNARDAMPKGGRLSISLDAGEGPDSTPTVVLTVRDDGAGISEETLRHVFEPFFTTKDGGRGTGLGMVTVNTIVESYGGTVGIESEVDVGTTVRVELPADLERVVPQRLDARPGLQGGSEHVLLVEDDPTVRELIVESLSQTGYQVRSSGDVTTARRLLDGEQGFDLLITDVVLPDGSGLDLAAQARRRLPNVRVLVISGWAGGDADVGGLGGTDWSFLAKPFTVRMLATAARAALDRPS